MKTKGKIGIQFSTLKASVKEYGIYETLKRCADIGYRCIEISQVPMTRENIEIFKQAKADFDMSVAALTAKVEPSMPGADCLENDYDKIVSDCRELGCNMLRMGAGPIYDIRSAEDTLAFCEKVNPYIDRLKADGIDYYYHNHAMEFRKFHGKYMLDIIRDHSNLGFELDTHWLHVGGQNPVDVIKQYAGRIRLLHLKDYRIVPPNMSFQEMRKLGINPQMGSVQFAEVGAGSLDMKGCIDTGLAGGAEFFLIEMDTTYERTPIESLQISYDNLCAMGYGDWF